MDTTQRAPSLRDFDKGTDHLSPEGVEERTQEFIAFSIRMTQGGKHRVYAYTGGKEVAQGVYDTFKEAQRAAAHGMTMLGMLTIDPERTIDTLIKNLSKKKP